MTAEQYTVGFYGLMEHMDTREILAANLTRLRAKHANTYPSDLSIEKATDKLGCKVGRTTVRRMCDGTTPVNLDFVEVVAKLFGLDAWQLLVPDMDPKHPPTLRSIGPTETDLYKKLDTLVKEFKGEEVKP